WRVACPAHAGRKPLIALPLSRPFGILAGTPDRSPGATDERHRTPRHPAPLRRRAGPPRYLVHDPPAKRPPDYLLVRHPVRGPQLRGRRRLRPRQGTLAARAGPDPTRRPALPRHLPRPLPPPGPGRLPGLLHRLDQRRLRPPGGPAGPDRRQ